MTSYQDLIAHKQGNTDQQQQHNDLRSARYERQEQNKIHSMNSCYPLMTSDC